MAETGTEGAHRRSTGPWNPEPIRVDTKQFSSRDVLDAIEDESLELAPDFQRGQVREPERKPRLIESVLLQIPLPAPYFAEDAGGPMRVADGLQSLDRNRSPSTRGCHFVQVPLHWYMPRKPQPDVVLQKQH
ncbi:DUF262 domain-containing protein [Streptomyces sp. NPDC056061]|uniref:DUF262 domain-containing protein n=1 Tax=Streptomyces sp. NPDC056061 TaxID=3345700 RepID=UPI0035DF2E67